MSDEEASQAYWKVCGRVKQHRKMNKYYCYAKEILRKIGLHSPFMHQLAESLLRHPVLLRHVSRAPLSTKEEEQTNVANRIMAFCHSLVQAGEV